MPLWEKRLTMMDKQMEEEQRMIDPYQAHMKEKDFNEKYKHLPEVVKEERKRLLKMPV